VHHVGHLPEWRSSLDLKIQGVGQNLRFFMAQSIRTELTQNYQYDNKET
jgi:hypothetical protein